MKEQYKVLVISHNMFGKTGNMGKTLAEMLSFLPKENMAQLYFHAEIPTLRQCERYFRVTDTDVLRSLFTRKAGCRIFGEEDVQEERAQSRVDEGVTAQVYQYAQRRTPFLYFARNLLWKLGKWDSDALRSWVEDFAPDVIFYASGDYAFSYEIACKLAAERKIPVAFWCCDDHYTQLKGKGLLAQYNHRVLRKWLAKLCKQSASALVISEEMRDTYEKILPLPLEILRIPAEENPYKKPQNQRNGIVYAGNLGLNRWVPLLELGKALQNAGLDAYDKIDVYSGEKDPKILAKLTEENGIRFHGAVSKEELMGVLGGVKYLLHVEAFDEKSRKATRFSLSTKIGESLRSGACILAYGPEEISSMRYLAQNGAACVLQTAEDIGAKILRLNRDEEAYNELISSAKCLAERCHNQKENHRLLDEILRKAAENGAKS